MPHPALADNSSRDAVRDGLPKSSGFRGTSVVTVKPPIRNQAASQVAGGSDRPEDYERRTGLEGLPPLENYHNRNRPQETVLQRSLSHLVSRQRVGRVLLRLIFPILAQA